MVFADDKGKSLTEIRVMSEPSNVPPLWSIEFLSHVTQGIVVPDLAEEWTISFKQPASDYLNFRYYSMLYVLHGTYCVTFFEAIFNFINLTKFVSFQQTQIR